MALVTADASSPPTSRLSYAMAGSTARPQFPQEHLVPCCRKVAETPATEATMGSLPKKVRRGIERADTAAAPRPSAVARRYGEDFILILSEMLMICLMFRCSSGWHVRYCFRRHVTGTTRLQQGPQHVLDAIFHSTTVVLFVLSGHVY